MRKGTEDVFVLENVFVCEVVYDLTPVPDDMLLVYLMEEILLKGCGRKCLCECILQVRCSLC